MDTNTLFLGKAAPQDDSSEGEDNASPPQRRKLSVPQNSVQRRALVQAQSQNRFGQRLPPQRIVDGVEGEGEEEEEKEEDEGKDQGLHTLLLFHSLTASLFVAE